MERNKLRGGEERVKKLSDRKGFTLVELMIVIAVIAILATLGLVGFRSAQQSARDTQRLNNIRGMQAALECYFSVNGQYPDDADMDWNTPPNTFKDDAASCFSGTSPYYDGVPAGDTVTDAAGTIQRGSQNVASYSYSVGSPPDSYTITLNGESRTMTVSSPS